MADTTHEAPFDLTARWRAKMPSLRSRADRPVHMGPHSMETLLRTDEIAQHIPAFVPLPHIADDDHPLACAMVDHRAMLDAIRDGFVNPVAAEIPDDLQERSQHLKAFGYFADASMVGICELSEDAILAQAVKNPEVTRLAQDLRTKQVRTLASGIEHIMADLRESMEAAPRGVADHCHAIVFLYAHPRPVTSREPGGAWIKGMEDHRSSLLAAETAMVIANYVRLLGWSALGHSLTASEVDLNRLATLAGLTIPVDETLTAPFVGARFSLAAVTTNMTLATDRPLAKKNKFARSRPAYTGRRYVDGLQPFERLKRTEKPTTLIDEDRIPRVPKRTDMFSRALFGDMGKKVQDGAKGGHYVRQSAPSMAQRRALGAFCLLQDGDAAKPRKALNADKAAEMVKAVSYFLGTDAVGLSRCPDWTWYSHDAQGEVINPHHDNAISLIIDQGFDTMEGASGDDWISVAQSMRAYLRFSLIGGVVARLLRDLGYSAKAHTVMDGDVLQPPLLLLSGLGEVSRIGEVILNPYLGPRLKSGVVTTNLPLTHDKPIDFGLQKFCESCLKCARECPSGAITAGPKTMFNGYETWKSDSQKCATYRITTEGGAMCGRCMKTCPWNLEGVLADAAFRWTAINIPGTAPALARLDDWLDRGALNPVKTWWWDLKVQENGGYRITDKPVNQRDLQNDLDLKHEDQTLAVYPAPLAPPPHPYPFPMDREAGIQAYKAMLSPDEYQSRLARGETENLVPGTKAVTESPILPLVVTRVDHLTDDVTRYELSDPKGRDLPAWEAGAHLDVMVAPEYLRQYSMCGDPLDRSRYVIAVLREGSGRGGSALMHRIFTKGRRIFASRPINHFPLHENAAFSVLLGGGIGITPMIAMAHNLHAADRPFVLHHSVRTRDTLAFGDELQAMSWVQNFKVHISDEGTRANLQTILAKTPKGTHVYVCGSPTYIESAMEAAQSVGIPEDRRHAEFFAAPEEPDRPSDPFVAVLARSGREVFVPADRSLADMLVEAGVAIDVKCSDGICGVCACGLLDGDVEHRDHVLSNKQREQKIITCRSRASNAGARITLDI